MFRAVKGTRDILPEQVEVWQRAERAAHEVFDRFGFREIRTPILESTDLFRSGLGSETDVVSKEMYTFEDRKGRSLTLRPENTAPVVRAYLENHRQRLGGLDRVYYLGPMFRYEQPQKGRYRQFHQIGVEVFGGAGAAIDAETIEMVLVFLDRLGIGGAVPALNSVGDETCRPAYRRSLFEALSGRAAELCRDCRVRLERNPLRILDCKVNECRLLLQEGPFLVDHLCGDCAGHFEAVRRYLDALGVEYRVEPRIVRGLDYYTRTTFEVTAAGLGAQDALLGGGRYDRLVESFGGPAVPAFGFAIGLDRLVLLLAGEAEGAERLRRGLFPVATGPDAVEWTLRAAQELRRRHIRVDNEFGDGSRKSQMRRAGRSDCSHVLIRLEGEEEGLVLRRLRDGHESRHRDGDWEGIAKEISVDRGE